jgi:hypothetical protein
MNNRLRKLKSTRDLEYNHHFNILGTIPLLKSNFQKFFPISNDLLELKLNQYFSNFIFFYQSTTFLLYFLNAASGANLIDHPELSAYSLSHPAALSTL